MLYLFANYSGKSVFELENICSFFFLLSLINCTQIQLISGKEN